MKTPGRSLTLWVNLGFLVLAKFYPKLSQSVCANPEITIQLVVMVNTLLRLKTKSAIGLTQWGYFALVLLIAGFILLGCATPVTQNLTPSKYFRRDLQIEYAGKAMDGAGVLPRAAYYDLKMIPKADMDLLLIRSCHREIVTEKASGGLFKKNAYSFYYEPVNHIENVGACPVKVDALESGSNQYSGAWVDFEDPKFQLPYRLYCNGQSKNVNGVGVCQARVGTTQVVAFDSPVRWAPAMPETCKMPVLREGYYELSISVGECSYVFDAQSGAGRLTTLGYQDIVLRKQ